MYKFTPGSYHINPHCPRSIMSNSGLHLATIKSYGETFKTDIANAKLFCAAPELLAVAYEMKEFLEHNDFPTQQGFRGFLGRIEDAILKAVE